MAVLAVAGVLAGCGGGSSGGNSSVPPLAAPQTFVAAKATVGDYFTWETTTRDKNTGEEGYSYSTKHFRSVGSDGAATVNYFSDYANATVSPVFTSSMNSMDLDSLGRSLRVSYGECTETTNPPLHLVAPYAVAVGMNWQYSGVVQAQCSFNPATQTSIEFKDSVLAIEQVTVPAGVFMAHKISRNETDEDGNFRTVADRICWWETDLGIDVKCVSNITRTNKLTGASRAATQTEVLEGYAKQKLARKFDTTLRFIGNWKGRIDGTTAFGQNVAGTCTVAIDWDGDISGGCFGSGVALNVTGKVNADGTLYFNSVNNSDGSPSFAGKIDSLQQMSGVWNIPAVGNGTWTIIQD
ncbi:hypothetical protein [Pseudoduganella sp. R-43]|uniref:hypothetical protein n=1 Tax=Pseudoduganella sp. R-43 TaxID=3404063 RepID=UPI003CF2BEDB